KWGRRTRKWRGPGLGSPCHASSLSCMAEGSASRASQEKGRRSRSPYRSAMSNELILIVKDNPKNLKLVRDTLQGKGYHTVETDTGEEGVQLARERRPALILMDIQLPGMNGIEALRELRADPRRGRFRSLRSQHRSWPRTVRRSWRLASMASRASPSACGSCWRRCERSWTGLELPRPVAAGWLAVA